jgi:type VI secretion system protein ImpC
MKCPTEIAISDRREAELSKNGFMPLIHRKNSDFAAFIGAQSLQKPPSTTIPTPPPTPRWPRACRTCSPATASRTT